MHSQHSKQGLADYNSNITDKLLQQFYGTNLSKRCCRNSQSMLILDEIDFSNGTDWKHLNQIRIGDLFVKSTPKYEIPTCILQGVDCSKNWTLVQTFTGYWLA